MEGSIICQNTLKRGFNMRKELLLFILLIMGCQSAKAMDARELIHVGNSLSSHHAPKLVRLDPEWEPESLAGKLPKEITIFDKHTTINDELLAKLNPEWQKLTHTLSRDEKNELVKRLLWYPGGDYSDYIKRCLYAQAIAIGADASTKRWADSSLAYGTLKDDYELAKYVLAKLPQEQKKFEQDAVRSAKSVQMAGLLLANDVPIPAGVVDNCVIQHRPAKLMEFYLQKGVSPNGCLNSFTALHNCTFDKDSLTYIPSLLSSGANISLKNFHGHTIFHQAANRDYLKFCECVVDYFLTKEKVAIISYLGCLKKNAPKFYHQTKHLHQALFRSFSSISMLQETLEIKDRDGQTAYEIKPFGILNPANCTYPKLKQLRCKGTLPANNHIQ
jgi:hypothetical protein